MLNKKKFRKKLIMFLYTFALVVVAFVLVFYISQSLTITRLNFKLENLEEKLKHINSKNKELELKLAQNTSLSKVENVARKKLNMKQPQAVEVIVLNNSHEIKKQKTKTIIEDRNNEQKLLFAQVMENIWKKLNVVKAESPK